MNTKKITNKIKFSLINKIGLATAFLSWLIGTVLVAWCYFMRDDFVSSIVGVCFCMGVVVALVINSIIVLLWVVFYKRSKGDIYTLLAIFANIPIGIVYFFIVIWVMMTYRIVLINNTDYPITAVLVHYNYIDNIQIDSHSSKKIKIVAQRDGALTMDYNYKNNRYQDTLIGYITSGGGGNFIYEFNENKNILTYNNGKKHIRLHEDLLLSKKIVK